MLGMAASSSTMNETGLSSQGGAISERKTATPSPSGNAMTSASSDENSVPKIKGSAPNSSCTGSQTVLVINPHPNFAIDAPDCRYISRAMKKTSRKTRSAKNIVRFLKTRSPMFSLFPAARSLERTEGGEVSTASPPPRTSPSLIRSLRSRSVTFLLQLLCGDNAADLLFTHLDHRPGQRSIVEIFRVALSIRVRPSEKLHQCRGFLPVLPLLIDQQPGEPGDRVRCRSISIRDGNAHVCRHGLDRACGGSGDSVKRRLYELACFVPQRGVREAILDGIGQLYISNGPFRLFHQPCHSFVPFPAKPNRPVHRCSLSNL